MILAHSVSLDLEPAVLYHTDLLFRSITAAWQIYYNNPHSKEPARV